MNSLSSSNTFNHYSRTYAFNSPISSNVNDNNINIEVLANIKNRFMESSNNQSDAIDVNNVWTKGTFTNKTKAKPEISLNLRGGKISWSNQDCNNEVCVKIEEDDEMDVATSDTNNTSLTADNDINSPSHHARRPMNAFLIFCKKHRPIVRRKFPNLENRGVTRILGEWWALLDDSDKNPYKDLAKEYKDAFFCANPNFKWYKLPAPPLRTLTTRPGSVQKESIHLSQNPTQANAHESEFTPGKLADESQLGSLSALLHVNSFTKTNETEIKTNAEDKIGKSDLKNNYFNYNNNVVENPIKTEPYLESPPTVIKDTPLPPKPIKKRKFIENFLDNNKNSVRNIFNTEKSDISDSLEPDVKILKLEQIKEEHDSQDSITNKELIEKIIDNTYQNQNTVPQNFSLSSVDLSNEPRKSGRSCKGKLYAEFMVNGKLIKNKREKRYSPVENIKKEEDDYNFNTTETKSDILPNFDLQNTIKRLAERTKANLNQIDEKFEPKETERVRTNSESSEDSLVKNKFDLQKRIDELPSLDYDNYMQRKQEIKKRKFTKNKLLHLANHPKHKLQNSISSSVNINYNNNNNNNVLIGSKKRKNKLSITHLETRDSHFLCTGGNNIENDDLSGLATLAEIASNKEKINQEKVLI